MTGVRFDQRLREAAAPAEPGTASDRRELGWQLVGWASLGLFLALVVLVTGTAPAAPPEAPRVGPVRAVVAAVPEPASTGWVLQPVTTPVERFYRGPLLWAYGCVGATCRDAHTHLGSYPRDFLAAVRTYGSGRLSSGPYRGRYLIRVAGVGFRLDTEPRDGRGRPLRAWRSAVAGALPAGTAARVVGCGGGALCARLRAAAWIVTERSGAVGARALRLYVGDQTGSPPAALRGAAVRVRRS